MKKIVILGAGSSGLIAATMIKRRWKGRVQVSVYYDSSKKNIGVGESTTPIVDMFVKQYLRVPIEKLIKETDTTVKLGISFKNWIEGTEYFHGFPELSFDVDEFSSATYSMLNGTYEGGILHSKATDLVPSYFFRYIHALHIDTQEFSQYIQDNIRHEVDFIDDIAEEINSDGKNIQSIKFKNSGEVTADFFIDASGFSSVLLEKLNPEWNDIRDMLPMDRAIPQQIPYDFKEVPSYTLAEARKHGWIWRIPVGDRFGTGYVYSSRFTTDEEAREDYNQWLQENFNVSLETDRIINYKPGYYKDNWIGNCMAVGLSSGFIEPLESTGLHIVINQMVSFIDQNPTLKNLSFNRRESNKTNKLLYEEIVDFICLHYNTNRTDSKFWQYMTENKSEWVKMFDEKCRNEFLQTANITTKFWDVESYIQVANGLKMFNTDSIKEYVMSLENYEDILDDCRSLDTEIRKAKELNSNVSQKDMFKFLHQ